LLAKLQPSLIYDAPCGDFNWMRLVRFPETTSYLGADIVRPLIEDLQARYADARRRFVVADVVEQAPPEADVWICRESLFHLSFREALLVIERWRTSSIPWFVATTTPALEVNRDVVTGGWRRLNLEIAPFMLGPPSERLADGAPADPSKGLGVWRHPSAS